MSGKNISTPRTTQAGVVQFSQPDKHSGEHKVFLFQINVTRDCNLRCSHCYISSEVKALSQRITVPQFIKIVRDIGTYMLGSESTHAEIHIVGGEPHFSVPPITTALWNRPMKS